MDVGSLSRKELQALCKEHGIKANQKTVILREALAAALGVEPASASPARDAEPEPTAPRPRESEAKEETTADGAVPADESLQEELQAKTRRQLQAMCKERGIKANQKTAVLVEALVEAMEGQTAEESDEEPCEAEAEAATPQRSPVQPATPKSTGGRSQAPAHTPTAPALGPEDALMEEEDEEEEEEEEEEDEFGPTEHELRVKARRQTVTAGTPARLAKLADRRRQRQEELKRRAEALKNAPKITPRRPSTLGLGGAGAASAASGQGGAAGQDAAPVSGIRRPSSSYAQRGAGSSRAGSERRPSSARSLSTSRPGFVPMKSTKPLTVASEFNLSFKHPRTASSAERSGSRSMARAGDGDGEGQARKRARKPLAARNIDRVISATSATPKTTFSFGASAQDKPLAGSGENGGGFALGVASKRGVTSSRARRARADQRRRTTAASAPQHRIALDKPAEARWAPASCTRGNDTAAAPDSAARTAAERQQVAKEKHLQRMMAAKRARERRFLEHGPPLSAANA